MRKKTKLFLRILFMIIAIILLPFITKGISIYKLNTNCIDYFYDNYGSAIEEFGLEIIQENWKLVALHNGEKYEVGMDGDFNHCHSAAIKYSYKLEREIGAEQTKKHATELGLKLLPLYEFLEYALSLESHFISYSNEDIEYDDEIVKQMQHEIAYIVYITPEDLHQTVEFETKVIHYIQLLKERANLLREGSSIAFQVDPYFYEEFALPIYEDFMNNDSEDLYTLPTVIFEPSKHWSNVKITEGNRNDWYHYVEKMKQKGN